MGGADDKGLALRQNVKLCGVLTGERRDNGQAVGCRSAGQCGTQEILSLVVRADINTQYGRFGGERVSNSHAHHALDGGGYKHRGTDQCCHRVARQADNGGGADMPRKQGLAGSHGDFPEIEREADIGQRLADKVIGPDTGTTYRHQHVALARLGKGFGQGACGVPCGGEHEHLGSGLLQAGRHHEQRGIENTILTHGVAGQGNFISRAQNAYTRFAGDGQPRMPTRRRKADFLGAESGARLQQACA